MSLVRCPWSEGHDLLTVYHDREWGLPLRDDRKIFEFLVLEGVQAGLSWLTVLKKRDAYRRAYDDFDPRKVARYSDQKIRSLLADPGLVRNRAKIRASVQNARAFLAVQEEFGTFSDYIWRFVDGRPVVNAWRTEAEVPVRTKVSQALSRDLKQRGFAFVGPTICYAHMQATGMVNDHLVDCFRHGEV
jgi:DNA-3-methyladenine glycosylase I